jgi:hypothetical protein
MAKRGSGRTGKGKAGSKKPIEQYEHTREDQKRLNNPPVGLVKPENDPDAGKQTYAYDPHLDPQLVWAGKAEHASFEVPTFSPARITSGLAPPARRPPAHGEALGVEVRGAGRKASILSPRLMPTLTRGHRPNPTGEGAVLRIERAVSRSLRAASWKAPRARATLRLRLQLPIAPSGKGG